MIITLSNDQCHFGYKQKLLQEPEACCQKQFELRQKKGLNNYACQKRNVVGKNGLHMEKQHRK
jgi:UDP-N-acetylenolpyruvoylglucosamine reductase